MMKLMKKIFGKKDVELIEFCDDKYVVVKIGKKTSIYLRKDYDEMQLFQPCVVKVMKNGLMGLISAEGRELISCECEDIRIDGEDVVIWRNGKLEKFSLSELLKED